MTLAAGTKLGSYEILAPLGAGGMGEVYRARDTRLGREVAIKVLPAERAADPDRRRRFEQEARSASALNHPNILTIHEVGTEGETTFIAMELVEGRTVRELVASGPVPTKKLLDVAAQTAEGLAKAHGAGIVHRDLKPENLMVSRDGFVKILDFGLAKLAEPDADGASTIQTAAGSPTEPGTVLGTAGYMSPEQAAGRPVDFHSDQFAFGSILYEMATGHRAFQRKTGAETLVAIMREEPEPIAASAPAAPAPLRWIVERCLMKDPEDRYASTKDLARDLASVRDHLSETSASASATSGAIEPVKAKRRGWLLPAAMALVGARRGSPSSRSAGRRQAAGASAVPADHLPARNDLLRAIRPRRPDDRLRRRVGRPAARDLFGAPRQHGGAAARAASGRRPLDLEDRRDGDLPRPPLPRRVREHGHARPRARSAAARRGRSSRTCRTPTGRPTGRPSPSRTTSATSSASSTRSARRSTRRPDG